MPYSNKYGNMLVKEKQPEDILIEIYGEKYRDYRNKWHQALNFQLNELNG